MGETRVDLLHLLEDLRDAYPGELEETILTEIVANSLDSGARTISLIADRARCTLTVVDDGSGMRRRELARYHDLAATSKARGKGIGFAGVGIKLGLLVADEVVTETMRDERRVATLWRLSSRKRAPWEWMVPPGLVGERGTAVRLRVQNAFSALLDEEYVRSSLVRHYRTLFDPRFDAILASHYGEGLRFVLNGRPLPREPTDEWERGELEVRLPRKRKPSALGYLFRAPAALPADERGMAVSTLGKVITCGWDWLGVSPAEPDTVGGLIEAPGLAECLTLNKADFLRSGPRGATYLAYRKAIQEAVSRWLTEWGESRDPSEGERRRVSRPVQRDLQTVLVDLAEEFPLLSALVERQSGGQRKLPVGGSGTGSGPAGAAGPDEPTFEGGAGAPAEGGGEPEATEAGAPEGSSPPPRAGAPTVVRPPAGKAGPKRPARYLLRIEFERRPDDRELARLAESTVWVNEAHPAYQRASGTRAKEYHVALSTAMALSRLAVEPGRQHEFVTRFLARWGRARNGKGRRRKR